MTHTKPHVHPKHRHAHATSNGHNRIKNLVTPVPSILPEPPPVAVLEPEPTPAPAPAPAPEAGAEPEGHGGMVNARLAQQKKVREATPVPQVCADSRAAIEANAANNLMFHEIAVTLMEQLNILKDSADFKVGQAIGVLNGLVTKIDKFTNLNA